MGRIAKISFTVAIFIISLLCFGFYRYISTHRVLKQEDPALVQSILESKNVGSAEIPAVKELLDEPNISGWIPYWDMERGIERAVVSSDKIFSVSPVWFYLNADGTLSKRISEEKILSYTRTIKDRGIKILLTITNGSSNELSFVLNSEKILTTHIENILSYVGQYGFDGIDIDYENINAKDVDVFSNTFLAALGQGLHTYGKTLSIAVLPKTDALIYRFSESRNAQDWALIGKNVDDFRIMGYDWTHNSTTAAGPISPALWLEEILEYAVSKVEKTKITLALPLYGYYWTKEGVSAVTHEDIEKMRLTAVEEGTEEASQEPYIETEAGEIWYQNAESIAARIKIAQSFGINSIIYWRLGGEDPDLWE